MNTEGQLPSWSKSCRCEKRDRALRLIARCLASTTPIVLLRKPMVSVVRFCFQFIFFLSLNKMQRYKVFVYLYFGLYSLWQKVVVPLSAIKYWYVFFIRVVGYGKNRLCVFILIQFIFKGLNSCMFCVSLKGWFKLGKNAYNLVWLKPGSLN